MSTGGFVRTITFSVWLPPAPVHAFPVTFSHAKDRSRVQYLSTNTNKDHHRSAAVHLKNNNHYRSARCQQRTTVTCFLIFKYPSAYGSFIVLLCLRRLEEYSSYTSGSVRYTSITGALVTKFFVTC
ncbi:hypothetical protein T07_3086 [Trichinella nelsoni]|uniref:Uncharacterized protein n=1 Tax=Trichinella nelsoni TaxID=6336 RepID=A0A0V0RG03_9BILA|nr:hypothetical protein T07_3086 [Trichinella nelsoni]